MSTVRRPIAAVLDGAPTPAWQARALQTLCESPLLEVLEVRLAGGRRRGRLRRAHAALERRFFYLGGDPYAATPLDRQGAAPAGAETPEASLVVWISEQPLPAEERRDVLYLRHGGVVEPAEEAFTRAVLAGAGYLETEALLRHDGETIAVERTYSGVRPFSTALSRDYALWKFAAMACRAAERLPGLDLPAAPPVAAGPPPSMLALLAHSAWTWPRALATRLLFRRPWHVRVRERRSQPLAGWSQPSRLVDWQRGHMYADPFLFEHDGRHHLFCEEVPYGTTRAVICHTELPLDGTAAAPPTTVLEQPYHLSYPFVFAHRGELYLIPETLAARRIELYRASDFPLRWEREAVLLDDLIASDATLLEHDDRLWLFAGIAVAGASTLDELHVFWADALHGPWHPHPLNPVVSDVRCARPAGAIQRWDGRLVRPGQDGSRRYGGAISFREIDVLSASDYAEHEIARLEARDLGNGRATHTYNADTRFEAVDLRRRELRAGLLFARRTAGSS